jgi:methylmalonyl-CoA mutase, N-terminal domain
VNRDQFDREFQDAPKRRDRWVTLSFEELPGVGLPEDGAEPPERIGYPGGFPYTRGIHTTGYRGKPWTIRQFAGFAGVEDTNARFRHLLAAGQDGLSVAFDMPTLMGLDSDTSQVAGRGGPLRGGRRQRRRHGRVVRPDPAR